MSAAEKLFRWRLSCSALSHGFHSYKPFLRRLFFIASQLSNDNGNKSLNYSLKNGELGTNICKRHIFQGKGASGKKAQKYFFCKLSTPQDHSVWKKIKLLHINANIFSFRYASIFWTYLCVLHVGFHCTSVCVRQASVECVMTECT